MEEEEEIDWQEPAKLRDQFAAARVITTGSSGIDACLGGGARVGEVIELCGASGSGKTQVLASLARNAKNPIIIEPGPRSLPLEALQPSCTVVPTSGPYELAMAISELEMMGHCHETSPELVAIDSLPLALGGPPPWASAQQSQAVGRLVKSLAAQGVATALSNHASGAEKPALGPKWQAVPHARAHLGMDGSVTSLSGPAAGMKRHFCVYSLGDVR